MSELPFEITTRLTDCRGNVLFTAVVDGADVAGETYKPGDGTKRRKLASVWVKDDRLRTGRLLTTTAIAQALETKEPRTGRSD